MRSEHRTIQLSLACNGFSSSTRLAQRVSLIQLSAITPQALGRLSSSPTEEYRKCEYGKIRFCRHAIYGGERFRNLDSVLMRIDEISRTEPIRTVCGMNSIRFCPLNGSVTPYDPAPKLRSEHQRKRGIRSSVKGISEFTLPLIEK